MKSSLDKLCLCCGSKSVKNKLTFDVADIFICHNSCIFSKPKVDTNSLYTPDYFKNNYEELKAEQAKALKITTHILKKYIKSGSILDYGCGIGAFLQIAEKNGFLDNIGIDISNYSTSIAQSVTTDSNFFNDKDLLSSRRFDCISFLDSLAHIDDANEVFSGLIRNNLKPDGIILIRTPNINRAYLTYVLLLKYLLPKKYLRSYLFIPNRFFLFNKKSINLFLEKHNMQVQEYFLEPDIKNDSSKFINSFSIKTIVDYILRIKIPALINRNNSMTLIAQIKNKT